MLSERDAIRRLWEYGHFANPVNPDTLDVEEDDLDKLTLADPVVKQAVRSYQDFMAIDGDRLAIEHHGRPMIHDGEVGPATRDLFEVARCAVPDYRREPLPAVGTGNWAGCHGVGSFHAAAVRVDASGMPPHLRPVFEEVRRRTTEAYAELGLKWVWDPPAGGRPEIDFSFVGSSSGWIGLAVVGRGRRCGDTIWCKYLASYRGGSTPEAVTRQWTSLVKHELGHNCGLEHSRGGVMNPSIVNGLPTSWKGDPSEPQLRRWFGGEPVPGGPAPDPDPDPDPPPAVDVRAAGTVTFSFPGGRRDFILVPKPVV